MAERPRVRETMRCFGPSRPKRRVRRIRRNSIGSAHTSAAAVGCLSLVLVDETDTDPHLNLRKSNRLFPIKTNLSYPQAGLPAVLRLLSLDSETLFNGNPGPSVLNLRGSRGTYLRDARPSCRCRRRRATQDLFSTKNGAPDPASHQGCKGLD